MSLIIVIFIALSLSMDAFSLGVAYATIGINENDKKKLSLIVGIYHFFMPLIGLFVGNKIMKLIPIESNIIVFLILFLIGIEMIIETFKEEKQIKKLNFFDMLTFGLAVSLDSFSIGLGLKAIYKYPLITVSTFFLISMITTYISLTIGNKINKTLGNISTIFGGIFLIIISLLFLCKVN